MQSEDQKTASSGKPNRLVIDRDEGMRLRRLEEAAKTSHPCRQIDFQTVDRSVLLRNMAVYGS